MPDYIPRLGLDMDVIGILGIAIVKSENTIWKNDINPFLIWMGEGH
jgi:hypothetical protein